MEINIGFEEFVDAFKMVMPYLREIMGQDVAVQMCNTTHFLVFEKARSFNLDILPNSSLPPGDPSLECMLKGKQTNVIVPAEVFGVPVKALSTPIVYQGEIVGSVGLGRNVSTEINITQMTAQLEEALEQVSSAVQQIAASAGDINDNQQRMNSSVIAIGEATDNIKVVLNFIKTIADQTKMLGLNAAIEAARAGEVGRGFGVVAEEIRKLSDESRQTTIRIKELAQQIEESVHTAKMMAEISGRASEEQAAATEEISASIEEISSTAQVLRNIAQIL